MRSYIWPNCQTVTAQQWYLLYIDYDRTTDTFKLKKDNKIKINDDSGDDIKFLTALTIFNNF